MENIFSPFRMVASGRERSPRNIESLSTNGNIRRDKRGPALTNAVYSFESALRIWIFEKEKEKEKKQSRPFLSRPPPSPSPCFHEKVKFEFVISVAWNDSVKNSWAITKRKGYESKVYSKRNYGCFFRETSFSSAFTRYTHTHTHTERRNRKTLRTAYFLLPSSRVCSSTGSIIFKRGAAL